MFKRSRLISRTAVLAVVIGVLAASAAVGQQRIAAIVNDDVISQHDVENRLEFVIGTSALANTSEVRQHLLPQVIQVLVDEHLKMQEAKTLQFSVSDQEIANAISMIEKQNGLPAGGFEHLVMSRHLNRTTATDQIRVEVAWYKVIQRTIRPQVKVGEDEIDAALQDLRDATSQPQNLLAEIFLPVDDPAREEEMYTLAERLVEQLRTGADFKAVARQFSQTASAATGGDLGWIPQGQLEPVVEDVLAHMQPGQLSLPIRTLAGYTIFLLQERREAKLADSVHFLLSQLFIPTTGPDAVPLQTSSKLIEAVREVSSCEAFDALAQKTRAPQSGSLGQIRAGDLPPVLRAAISRLALRTASAPVSVQDGLVVLMVCDRVEPALPNMPTREEIAYRLEIEKIAMIQRRKLRDLRRIAFIEVRL